MIRSGILKVKKMGWRPSMNVGKSERIRCPHRRAWVILFRLGQDGYELSAPMGAPIVYHKNRNPSMLEERPQRSVILRSKATKNLRRNKRPAGGRFFTSFRMTMRDEKRKHAPSNVILRSGATKNLRRNERQEGGRFFTHSIRSE